MADFGEPMANILTNTQDDELLTLVEGIITEELKKSSPINGKKEDKELGPTEGDMAPSDNGSTGSAPQEANPKTGKKKMETKEEVKKSQADLEGKETGGLAPSVQGDEMALMSGSSSKGDSQTEANKGNVFEMANGAKDTEQKEKNKNKKKGETQDGDAQDEANTDAKVQQEGEAKTPAGGSSAGHETQSGSSQMEANQGNHFTDTLRKSVETLADVVKNLVVEVQELKKGSSSGEKIEKSVVYADLTEKLAKSYLGQIEKMEKSYTSKVEALSKSNADLSAKCDDLAKSLKKPATTRQTLTNVQEIKKGNSEETSKRIFKSKEETLIAMEELRKSNKITGDELIAYNVSNVLSDNAKRQLLSK